MIGASLDVKLFSRIEKYNKWRSPAETVGIDIDAVSENCKSCADKVLATEADMGDMFLCNT